MKYLKHTRRYAEQYNEHRVTSTQLQKSNTSNMIGAQEESPSITQISSFPQSTRCLKRMFIIFIRFITFIIYARVLA